MSEEYIADRGYRSDGPVDLDELHEQEEHSSTADRGHQSDGPVDLYELYEHEQEQYTSSFRPVSHNSIVSGKNNNASLPHCCAIAATDNNTSNNSDNNINDTVDGKNNVLSSNSIIIDSFPRVQSMLDEPMNDMFRSWTRRQQNTCSSSGGSGSGSDSNSSMRNSRNKNASKNTLQSNNGITNDSSNSNNNSNNSNNSVSTNINSSSPISISSSSNNNNVNNNNVNNNNNNSNVNNNNNNVNNNNSNVNSNNVNNNNNENSNNLNNDNSMGNISDTIYNSNVYINPEINTGTYPPDTYSILALHGPIENPAYFSFGLMVYLFQMTFLLLMVLSVVHPRWSSIVNVDNPDAGRDSLVQLIAIIVPSQVTPLVRMTQIMATLTYIIFGNPTICDIVLGVELFPSFKQATSDDKVRYMVFSSILRLSQGILAIIVTLFLIVTTSNVIEIILNFTAVNFISNLDDVGFEVIKWGKYGTKFKVEAYRIENEPLPQCIKRKRKSKLYWYSVIPIGVVLTACLCVIFILQGSNDHWVTKIFRVQFQDKEQGLQVYNGCYEKYEVDVIQKDENGRKFYESFENNSASAQFGYCIDDHRWILFKGNATDACEARKSENDTEVAHSSRTDTFDVSTMFGETWYSASNTPLDVYFIEGGDFDKLNATCLSFINDGECDLSFNSFDYQYDGGDCCAATCSGSSCGIGSLKNAFGATYNITSGDGFPNCLDPTMVPITIRLDNFLSSFDPQFIYDTINKNLSSADNLDNFFDDDFYSSREESLTREPVKPLLFLNCDGNKVLNIYVDESMENATETVMVNDGADCSMTIRNDSGFDPIWYADYTILYGDEKSTESNSIVVAQSSSAKESTYDFKRIPECYFDKLSEYIDNSTVYAGIDYDPTAKAIDWLMNDGSEDPICEDSFFHERYALAVISFAAPSISSSYSLINTTRQCVWSSIICDEGTVISLDMSK
jgi:hypothetical protein